MPLIEIPVNATEEEREEWEEARKSMGQCNCLESFSRDLWSQWDELVESGMVEDSDRKKKFEELMHATYYSTLCEVQSKAVVKHRVDIDTKCDEEKLRFLQDLVVKATQKDALDAEENVRSMRSMFA